MPAPKLSDTERRCKRCHITKPRAHFTQYGEVCLDCKIAARDARESRCKGKKYGYTHQKAWVSRNRDEWNLYQRERKQKLVDTPN